MPLAQLLNIPCVIYRRSTSEDDPEATESVDDYNTPVPPEVDDSDEDETYDLETTCELQQRRRDEPGDAGELSVTDWLLVLPAGTDIDTSDHVWVEGFGTFEVVGDPWQARNPRTRQFSHVEATVRMTGKPELGS